MNQLPVSFLFTGCFLILAGNKNKKKFIKLIWEVEMRIIQERPQDVVLNPRQKDGVDAALDPSRYNRIMTYRDTIFVISQEAANVEIIHRGVNDLAELRAISPSSGDRADRMVVLVENDSTDTNNGIFRYDEQETATESLPFVVEPNDSTGRWIQISKATVAHNSFGQLQGGNGTQRYHVLQGQHDAASGTVGTPSNANRFVTKEDPQYLVENAFDFSSTFPLSIKTTLVGERIIFVGIVIETPFDGSALFTVGTDETPNLLATITQNDPEQIGVYDIVINQVFISSEVLKLFLSGVPTVGAGKVFIKGII